MSTRTLRPGDPIPDSTPLRYLSRGYYVLRWRVGPKEYVEVREHRLVMDAPVGSHVHHIDHDPLNNDPSNLAVLSVEDHTSYHAGLKRKVDVTRAAALYAAGYSTVEIGHLMGVDHSNVWRRLHEAGVSMRPRGIYTERGLARMSASVVESHTKPEVRARRSEGIARAWARKTPEQRAEIGRRISEAKRRRTVA